VEDDLEQGSLIQLFSDALQTGKSYYLVRGNDRPLSAAAQLFCDWLFGAALLDQGGIRSLTKSVLQPGLR